MAEISRKNFEMFQTLCGNKALRNVVIVTDMWEEVNLQVGNAHGAELAKEGTLFKPALEKGAQMARHENTIPSAENVIRLVLDNHPLPLRIQEELVGEGKDISQTSAGEELNRVLSAKIRRHQLVMQEMQHVMRSKDGETKRGLEIEIERMQREVEKLRDDGGRLPSDYKKEKERLEVRLEQMQEAGTPVAKYQQQIDELRNEKAHLLKQIDKYRGGFFSKIGALFDRMLFFFLPS